jgi:cytochrome c556
MQKTLRKLSVLAMLIGGLGIGGVALAKSPEEQALKEYGSAMHELGGILSQIKDIPSAKANVPALDQQIKRLQALKPVLVTQPEGNPAEPPKDNKGKDRSDKMRKLSEQLQQTSDRMTKEMQRVLADPDLATIVGPVVGQLGQE